MKRYLIKWWYRRRFQKAYRILEGLASRHRDAGHEMYFNAVNEADLHLSCVKCPEFQPLRRKPEDVKHITVGSDGRPYRP